MNSPKSYLCDTLPAPRLASAANDTDDAEVAAKTAAGDAPSTVIDETDAASVQSSKMSLSKPSPSQRSSAPSRKLCVRHQRMADEGVNMKLQQSLDALPMEEREAVTAVWSQFSSSSHARRAIILQGLLTLCCFPQLSLLTDSLQHLIRIDPFAVLPREMGLKILGYLDATSLCRTAQVSRRWKALADDDILWRGICEQHIGQKCHKCGWGLPLLDKKRSYRAQSSTPVPSIAAPLPHPHSCSLSVKRPRDSTPEPEQQPAKRPRSEGPSYDHIGQSQVESSHHASLSLIVPTSPGPLSPSSTRPWKEVYSERMTVEWNWRRGRCTVRTLEGHTDGVMCLQFNENLTHPAFPVLITGSYDRTARVWNLETGMELHVLRGHTRAIRALQFDEFKLITGSMDCSLKVWDWRRGTCIRTLFGHTEGVVCLNFDSNILASGSVDSTIKVWNLRTGCAFTLRGHRDWVNSVQLWDRTAGETSYPPAPTVFDSTPCSGSGSSGGADPGKMLFSASDDGTIRLWDLHLRTCVRQFTGHIGQVQSIKLMFTPDCDDGDDSDADDGASRASTPAPRVKLPTLISGSLDNTIKAWDVETGQCTRTYFGHIGGVWAVAADKMRIVSGSHDRTIKVWSPDSGSNIATLAGHEAAVSCIALGEDKIISGGDDKSIKVWSFAG